MELFSLLSKYSIAILNLYYLVPQIKKKMKKIVASYNDLALAKQKKSRKGFSMYSVNVWEDLEKWCSQTTLTRRSG